MDGDGSRGFWFSERQREIKGATHAQRNQDFRLRHASPTVETIIPYLEPELREQAHQWRKVPVRIDMAGERYQPPHRHYFSFSHPHEGWNKESTRMLG